MERKLESWRDEASLDTFQQKKWGSSACRMETGTSPSHTPLLLSGQHPRRHMHLASPLPCEAL